MNAPPPMALRIWVDCDDDAVRLRLDDVLLALPQTQVQVQEQMRPQDADLVLACREVSSAQQIRDAVGRAGSDALVVRCVAGDAPDLDAALADGFDEVLGLDEPPQRWSRQLRLIALWRSERRRAAALAGTYRDAVRGGSLGRWRWDLGTGVLWLDPAWKAMIGYTADEVQNDTESWFSRVGPSDRDRLRASLDGVIEGGARRFEVEHRIQHRDRTYLWVRTAGELRSDDHGLRIEGTQTEITAEKLAALRLADADRRDRLTGTLSRDAFLAQLGSRLEQEPRQFALGLCDVDLLKHVNRRHGRRIGDEVLVWIGGLLEDRLGDGGIFGRTSGDAFAFVLEGEDFVRYAQAAAEMREELLNETFYASTGDEVRVTATLAVVERPQDAISAADLLRRAGRALEKARATQEGLLLVRSDAALETQDTLRLPIQPDLEG
ncbi:MAG: sensor domain-containing diguanylate cyclase [Deltaproteobacteria bacterium]|nr:sensor domain-containing diguanylate cyclase [Deltaproteobacteria bacterium]